MNTIDRSKLRLFDIREWLKNPTQKVYTADGREVTKLTDFGTSAYPLVGVIGGVKESWTCGGAILDGSKGAGDLRLALIWQLEPPPWGAWHNAEYFREGDLAEGERPLMVGENKVIGDLFDFVFTDPRAWDRWTTGDVAELATDFLYKTSRPLPDRWAAEKAAFAAGKRIQYRSRADIHDEWGAWGIITNPLWIYDNCHEYRIAPEQPKPEPKWRDLTPEDVPPGSRFRHKDKPGRELCPSVINAGCIEFIVWSHFGDGRAELIAPFWGTLAKCWEILRPGGQWQPCKVEVTE